MPEGPETELTLVCGADRLETATVAAGLRRGRAAVLVAHDLRGLGEGVVHRRVVEHDREHDVGLELAHGCVACTLREDLLPLLPRLGRDPGVEHVVLLLDPGLEVGALCRALHSLVPEGSDGPVTDVLAVRGVVAVLDAATWLDDAGSDVALAERALPGPVVDPATIVEALDAALLTDDELALGEDAWRRFPDPFAHRHTDPCDDLEGEAGLRSGRHEGGAR